MSGSEKGGGGDQAVKLGVKFRVDTSLEALERFFARLSRGPEEARSPHSVTVPTKTHARLGAAGIVDTASSEPPLLSHPPPPDRREDGSKDFCSASEASSIAGVPRKGRDRPEGASEASRARPLPGTPEESRRDVDR